MKIPTVLLLAALMPAAFAQAQSQSAEEDLATVYNFVKVSDGISTSGQIPYDQVEELKEAGYDVVVNLATASESSNALEGYLVTQSGLTYVQIPVPWQAPGLRDLQMFFDVMKVNTDRRVWVHCAANMRASVFTYLYRTLEAGVPEAEARKALDAVWDPSQNEQWASLIQQAKAHYSSTN